MKDLVAQRSAAEGFPESRLPKFTPEEVQFIKGTYDFFCLNHYSSVYGAKTDYPIGKPSLDYDTGARAFYDDNWEQAASSWVNVSTI